MPRASGWKSGTVNRVDAHPLRWVFFALFTLSGVAGLIYQVLWARQFTLVLGASTYAVTVVLAVFMAGLGLGAWVLGKMADRYDENQLARCYVLLEVGIAAYALLLPWLLRGAEAGYTTLCRAAAPSLSTINATRLLVAFALLILPTSLMGATLPVLSRYVIRNRSRISVNVSWLYGLNTLGALCGAVAAGYLLLPAVGMAQTNFVAVAVNALVAVAFWIAHRMTLATPSEAASESRQRVTIGSEPAGPLSPLEKTALVAFAISGFAAMLYEVAWTRTLTMILGTTTFSFTTMVATFLFGIAAGSLLFAGLRRLMSPGRLLVWLQWVIALSALLAIPLFERLPLLYLSLDHLVGESWAAAQVVRFALAALVMLVPTLALGVTFPAVAALLVGKTEILGRRLGRAYGINTIGAVLGALFAGLVAVPVLGLQHTIILGAALNLTAGVLVALALAERPATRRVATAVVAGVVFVGLVTLLKPWSPGVINSGVYVYADRYRKVIDRIESASEVELPVTGWNQWRIWQAAMSQYDLLYYKTGPTATVAVMQRDDGVRFLSIDGKTDASTAKAHDMKTQVMLGHLPLLFHPRPDQVLVVGLGSGVTVGSVLSHDVRVVDCAELSPAVVEAAEYFSEVNRRPWEDRRLELMPRDARNVLLTSDARYDAIISQPSNPWIRGQSNLFSLEWYQLVHDHLRDEGMLAQWFPAYHMSLEDVKIIIHTMRQVFPETTLWTSGAGGDLILIAKKGNKLRIDYQRLLETASQPAVRNDLARIGFQPVEILPRTFVMNADEVGEFLYADRRAPLPVNTDDRLITEFTAPKHMLRQAVVHRFANARQISGDVSSLLSLVTNFTPTAETEEATQ